MDVELFIHGVPAGQDVWGDDKADQAYFKTMYGNSVDEVKFMIQVRNLNGKLYCYYNYLICGNVIDFSGRGGSYLGISLRLDEYCKEVLNVYRILDAVYNMSVVGSIISLDANKKKYLVSDFASASTSLTQIKDLVYSKMNATFKSNSFLPLNESFVLKGENILTLNLYDFTQEEILSRVKQDGQIVISPYYESKKERSLCQQIATQNQIAQKEFEARSKADAESREREKKEADDLKNKLSLKGNEIQNLNNEITRLKNELKIFGLKKELQEIILPIKEPIWQMSTLFKQIASNSADFPKQKSGESELGKEESKKQNTHTNRVSEILKSVFFCLGFILICYLVYMSYTISGRLDESNQIANKGWNTKSIDEEATVKDAVGPNADENTNSEEAVTADFNIDTVQIDVISYNGKGPLELGRTYKIVAINGDDSGSWTVEGCITEAENSKSIEIKPNAGDVEIEYHVGSKTKSRQLRAE